MQKDIPPVPLAEPAKETAKAVKKAGRNIVRYVTNIKELRVIRKREKDEISPFD